MMNFQTPVAIRTSTKTLKRIFPPGSVVWPLKNLPRVFENSTEMKTGYFSPEIHSPYFQPRNFLFAHGLYTQTVVTINVTPIPASTFVDDKLAGILSANEMDVSSTSCWKTLDELLSLLDCPIIRMCVMGPVSHCRSDRFICWKLHADKPKIHFAKEDVVFEKTLLWERTDLESYEMLLVQFTDKTRDVTFVGDMLECGFQIVVLESNDEVLMLEREITSVVSRSQAAETISTMSPLR
jgi:hypothetical protein